MVKQCSTCHQQKDTDNFHNNKNTKDGKSSRCKHCATIAADIYFENNYERVLENKRKRRSDIRYSLREAAKDRSNILNLPFDLTISDIIIPEFCPVLGLKLEKSSTGKHQPNSPSLDRIIPELGYVKNNIVVMSYKANTMKNNATINELLLFSDWVNSTFKNG